MCVLKSPGGVQIMLLLLLLWKGDTIFCCLAQCVPKQCYSFVLICTRYSLLLHFRLFNANISSWSSGNVFVSGAGGLRFKSRAGEIEHSVANGSPPLQQFLERSEQCCSGAMMRKWAPRTRCLYASA